jgi:hypothetical protein
MNGFEIGKPPLRANVGHPPLEEPAKVKNPGPKGQALVHPIRVMCAAVQPKGMVEWWKNGIVGGEKRCWSDLILRAMPRIKIRSYSTKPSIPAFHYSSIPRP